MCVSYSSVTSSIAQTDRGSVDVDDDVMATMTMTMTMM